MVIEPGRPKVEPFPVMPENVCRFFSFYRVKKILEFGKAVIAQSEFRGVRRGGARGLSGIKVIPTHGTLEMARSALDRPFNRFGSVTIGL